MILFSHPHSVSLIRLFPEKLLHELVSDTPVFLANEKIVKPLSEFSSIILEKIQDGSFEYTDLPSLIKFVQKYESHQLQNERYMSKCYIDETTDSSNHLISVSVLSEFVNDTDFAAEVEANLSAESFLSEIEDTAIAINLFTGIDLYSVLQILNICNIPDTLYQDTLKALRFIFKEDGPIRSLFPKGFDDFKRDFITLATNQSLEFAYI